MTEEQAKERAWKLLRTGRVVKVIETIIPTTNESDWHVEHAPITRELRELWWEEKV